ncbi:hypothetical protein ACC695_41040, partial [Rhizobium ruizarguesonis]
VCLQPFRRGEVSRLFLAEIGLAGADVAEIRTCFHAPEFAFEKKIDNVKKAIGDFKIGYPVAIDNDYSIWRTFEKSY